MIDTERVKRAVENKNPPDCYATAFYLTGYTEKDRPLTATEIRNHLKSCSEINSPLPGCFVHIWNGFISHLAVVENISPVTVTYRDGMGGEVRVNVPITKMLCDYGGLDIGLSYLKKK